MKYLLLLTLFAFGLNATGQKDLNQLTKPIVEEGKMLYQSEMASWHGTDLFLENYKNHENIGGYFSYSEDEEIRCVFFSRAESPKVIGVIQFDSTFQIEKAIIDLKERTFSEKEDDLYQIRKNALIEVNRDTSFKQYQNTNFNFIPLVNNKEKKVYILTGASVSGVVIFGNDYLLTFDDNNQLLSKKSLHKNIIPIFYEEEKKAEEVVHSHLPETGEFITPTDICTLMLYSKYANWKQHIVVSEKYMNIWDCVEHQLTVIPMETIRNIKEEQDKN